ncbi:MFS transporter [Sphingosinicellaceae bacterium]|nr:MFS transporter [Sphingosinicellaceae bacterium]
MQLSRATLFAFAAPCLPMAAVGLPVVVYLPPYYAHELGLGLPAVGIIFLVVRLIDIPLDPILGHLIDRTRGRFGRFQPWLVGGAVLLSLGALAAFMAQPGISAVAALAGLAVMYFGYSATMVAQTAWGATLSDDYHERSRVFGWWMALTQAGMLIVLTLPPLLPRLIPGAGVAAGIHAMGWLVIAGAPLAALWCCAVVRERPRPGGHVGKLSDFRAVLANPLMRRLLLVDMLSNLAPGVTGALFLFFFQAVKGYAPAAASSLLLVYFLGGLAGVPLWTGLARLTSKHYAMIVALLVYCVAQALTFSLPASNWPVAALGMALAGIPYGASTLLLRAMLADLADAETLSSGNAKTGLFYAAGVAVQKLGYAIPIGLLYPLLGAVGFAAAKGGDNSPEAIAWVTGLFAGLPVLLALAAAWTVRGWPIDATTQSATASALRGDGPA